MAESSIVEAVDNVPGRPEVTAWRRAARRHQVQWREEQGWPPGTQRLPKAKGGGTRLIRSRVDEVFARKHGVNFLDDMAWRAAVDRVEKPVKHQMLNSTRLFCDLLSSMPMCFNFFGPLWDDPALAAGVVHRWFPTFCPEGAQVAVSFEWSPGRCDARWLGDRTAFDAAIHIRAEDGLRLIGVETKYHEYPTTGPVIRRKRGVERRRPQNPRYGEVTEAAGLFADPDWFGHVWGQDVEQVWRDHLLALACQQASPDVVDVRYVLLAPAGNPGWPNVSEKYEALLSPVGRSTFEFVTLEGLLDEAGDLLPHAEQFRARYLDVVVGEQKAGGSDWVHETASQDDHRHLYVIGEADEDTAVKIGIARRTLGRLAELNSGNPRRLELLHESLVPHGRWVEYQLHQILEPWRVRRNGEWFDVRRLVDSDGWQGLIDRALQGELPGAAPSSVPAPRSGHALLHVRGLPRALTACCTCGWESEVGVMDRVLSAARIHLQQVGP